MVLQCHTVSLRVRQCVAKQDSLYQMQPSEKQFRLACAFRLLEFYMCAPTQLDAALQTKVGDDTHMADIVPPGVWP